MQEYVKINGCEVEVKVKDYSIFISYIDDTTIMCEFVYDDLCLKILIDNTDDNIKLFNVVCKFLIEVVQDRISNDNIDDKIEAFLHDNAICDGLTKEGY